MRAVGMSANMCTEFKEINLFPVGYRGLLFEKLSLAIHWRLMEFLCRQSDSNTHGPRANTVLARG